MLAIVSGSSVNLVGILRDGSGSSSSVCSPIVNIQDDLGNFAAK